MKTKIERNQIKVKREYLKVDKKCLKGLKTTLLVMSCFNKYKFSKTAVDLFTKCFDRKSEDKVHPEYKTAFFDIELLNNLTTIVSSIPKEDIVDEEIDKKIINELEVNIPECLKSRKELLNISDEEFYKYVSNQKEEQ